MDISEFDYGLPEALIAQEPLEKRDQSRLMVLDPESEKITHSEFSRLADFLPENAVLVLNNTRVLRARLHGVKASTGASIEFLLMSDLGNNRWEALMKPAKRLQEGQLITFPKSALQAIVLEKHPEGLGVLEFSGAQDVFAAIQEIGEIPLPPYIHTALQNQERYQTVYSSVMGSCAAPTAGLHFTDQVFASCRDKGIDICEVTLHVGLGTFRPVQAQRIEEHPMHRESYRIDEQTAQFLNQAKRQGRPIIGVGTTSVRTLESAAQEGYLKNLKGETQIFIYPPYQFKFVDALITNFHLPKSTLLMMISAFAGTEFVRTAYQVAIERQYRFFSFGDAMLIQRPAKGSTDDECHTV